ncbi:glycosyltransferase family 39 protein [Candidatus Daviesbacteria bacterium]|nr:glycosyltransferase family 39 protein [Candidatus Daviesbacteria bacterium]
MNKYLTYLKQTKVQILIFALLIAIFYGNTLSNGFVHDDVWQVETNKNIKSIQKIPKIFSGCIGEDLIGSCSERGYYYRPLQNISYLLIYQISDQPWMFHFLNITLLFILSLVVYLFFKLILKKWKFAFLGTIIFLINPIISEVVNWISSAPELLMSIFIILSLIFAIKFAQSAKIAQFVLSLVFLFLALLSKETAVFLVPLVLILFIFKSQEIRDTGNEIRKKRITYLVSLMFASAFMVMLFFVIRVVVLGRVVYQYEGYYELSSYEQILNAFYFYGKYILKLIYPLPLSFQQIFLPIHAATPGVAVGILLAIINLSLIVWFWKKGFRVLVLGLLMINLSILPALVFINKIGEFLFSERYLFFASVGVALIITETLRLSLTTRSWKWGLGVLGILGIICFWVVFNRNMDWKDNITSYSAMIRLDPSYARAYFQRGELYLSHGLLEESKKEYEMAVKFDPSNLVYKQKLTNFPILFRSKNGIEFLYPKSWKVEESEDRVILKDPNQKLSLTISNVILDPASPEKNLKTNLEIFLYAQDDKDSQDDKETHGNLVNQGQALIPGWDSAYVKVWDPVPDGTGQVQGQILQFFLFKDNKVIKVLVNPAIPELMGEVDGILGSIKIE